LRLNSGSLHDEFRLIYRFSKSPPSPAGELTSD
jgi:hypothetical protein